MLYVLFYQLYALFHLLYLSFISSVLSSISSVLSSISSILSSISSMLHALCSLPTDQRAHPHGRTAAASMVFIAPTIPQWTWTAGITFGAMVSATDPVAVVALLKELGAPVGLSTLIEGESLFNDGTAYVLFVLGKTLLEQEGTASDGSCTTPGNIIWFFIRLVVFGLGLVSFGRHRKRGTDRETQRHRDRERTLIRLRTRTCTRTRTRIRTPPRATSLGSSLSQSSASSGTTCSPRSR